MLQDAEEAAKQLSRNMARQAVGVLDAGRGGPANARRTYAQDLEDQIQAKKVCAFARSCSPVVPGFLCPWSISCVSLHLPTRREGHCADEPTLC